MSNAEQTLEAVEGMTPVKKTKEEVEGQENNKSEEEKNKSVLQLTQLDAIFKLEKVNISPSSNFPFSFRLLSRLIYILTKQQVMIILINHFCALRWKQS